MPITTTTAGTYDALLSTTLYKYSTKNLQDAIFDDLVFFYVLMGRHQEGLKADRPGARPAAAKKRKLTGGESIVVPIMYEANSTANSYTGYDTLDVTPQDGVTLAQYAWKQISVSISINGREERMNGDSETKMLDLLKSKIKQAEMSLANTISTQLFGDGTGNSSKDITGLQAIVANSPTTGTLAGINRATYSWWRNQSRSSAGSFAANGVNYMRQMFNDCARGQKKPQLILTTQDVFEFYEDALRPEYRNTNKTLGDGGFENLDFKSIPVVYDLDCPSGNMYFLNFDFLEWVVHEDADFATTPFVRPENQDARVAQVLVMGNLTCSNCRFQGVISGFTQ